MFILNAIATGLAGIETNATRIDQIGLYRNEVFDAHNMGLMSDHDFTTELAKITFKEQLAHKAQAFCVNSIKLALSALEKIGSIMTNN